jgi:hypothetical protein
VIRNDLVKIFERLGVKYRPIQGGFECAHAPSIDLSSVGSPRSDYNEPPSTPSRAGSGVRRRGSKKVEGGAGIIGRSPLSRGGFGGGGGGGGSSSAGDRDDAVSQSSITRDVSTAGGGPTSSSSFGVVAANAFDEAPASPMGLAVHAAGAGAGRDTSATATTLDSQTARTNSSLIVRFEVYIVKVAFSLFFVLFLFWKLALTVWCVI